MLTAKIFQRGSGRAAKEMPVAIFLAAVLLAALSVFFGTTSEALADEGTTYTVAGLFEDSTLTLRSSGIYTEDNAIGQLENGDTVQAISFKGNGLWYVYVPKTGQYGFVDHYFLKGSGRPSLINPRYVDLSGAYATAYLALRSEKVYGTSNITGALYDGDTVMVIDASHPFYWYVYAPGLGMRGYVNRKYLSGDGPGGETEEARIDIWTEGPIFGANAGSILTRCQNGNVSLSQVTWQAYDVDGTKVVMAANERFMRSQTYVLSGYLEGNSALLSNAQVYVNGIEAEVARPRISLIAFSVELRCFPESFLVSFDMNGHGSQIAPQRLQPHGYACEIMEPPYDPDAVFAGYYVRSYPGGQEALVPFEFDAPIKENTSVVCGWNEYVREISFDMSLPLAGGRVRDARASVVVGGVRPEYLEWHDENGDELDRDDYFRTGRTYGYTLYLRAEEGFIFDDSPILVTAETGIVAGYEKIYDDLIEVTGSCTAEAGTVTITFEAALEGDALPSPVTALSEDTYREAFLSALGALPVLPGRDGYVFAWWEKVGAYSEEERYIDLDSPVGSDVTLRPSWRLPVEEIHVRAAIPQDGETMLVQARYEKEPSWSVHQLWFEAQEPDFTGGPFEAGMEAAIHIGLLSGDGYALCSMDGSFMSRVFVNGIEADTARGRSDGAYSPGIQALFSFTVPSPGETMVLPSSLTGIGEEAFAFTDAWKVIVPEGVTRIDARAFAGCGHLQRVILPASLSSLSTDAFLGCPSSLMIVAGSQEAAALAEAAGVIVYHEPAG